MHPYVKNIIAVLIGWLVGAGVNMGLVMLGPELIPPPEGMDMTTMEGIKEAMPLLKPKHFIFPFLAHGLGTLVGAFFASRLAATFNFGAAMLIGIFFLLGGLSMSMNLPQPTWFTAADLCLAYIPMAWIGYRLSGKAQ